MFLSKTYIYFSNKFIWGLKHSHTYILLILWHMCISKIINEITSKYASSMVFWFVGWSWESQMFYFLCKYVAFIYLCAFLSGSRKKIFFNCYCREYECFSVQFISIHIKKKELLWHLRSSVPMRETQRLHNLFS